MSQPSRNGPCPCGSGRKYKRCCGANAAQAAGNVPPAAASLDIARGALKLGDTGRARAALAGLVEGKGCKDARAWSLAAQIEMADRRFVDAVRFAERAVHLDPGNTRHQYNLGTVLSLAGDKVRAAELLTAVLDAEPTLHEARINLANTQRDLGRMSDALENYLLVADSPRVDLGLLNHVLLTSQLYDLPDDDLRYHLHCRIGDRLTEEAPTPPPLALQDGAPPERRLRIGYLSPRFSREIVGYFLRPIVENHDRGRVELFFYDATKRRDDLSEWFRDQSRCWRDVSRCSDTELCRQIVGDRIDVLIDLAGHAPENRLRAIARKPAPIMVSMLDYFDTTGVPTMDYFVTDAVSTPPESTQRFRERLLRMSRPRLVYAPPEYAPAVAKRTALDEPLTFGSFNRSHKITEPVIALWSRLLLAIEGARLVLKASSYAEQAVRAAMREQFARHGITAERLEFREASPHRDLLDEYNDIDIALDTFPYNGGLTTAEALWMGTPVITKLGARIIGRQSAAFLSALGLDDWIAPGAGEFVAIGEHWAARRSELRLVQNQLRSRMERSPLTDGAAFARELEEHLLAAFAEWRDTTESGSASGLPTSA